MQQRLHRPHNHYWWYRYCQSSSGRILIRFDGRLVERLLCCSDKPEICLRELYCDIFLPVFKYFFHGVCCIIFFRDFISETGSWALSRAVLWAQDPLGRSRAVKLCPTLRPCRRPQRPPLPNSSETAPSPPGERHQSRPRDRLGNFSFSIILFKITVLLFFKMCYEVFNFKLY